MIALSRNTKLGIAVYAIFLVGYAAASGNRILHRSNNIHFSYQADMFLHRHLDLGHDLAGVSRIVIYPAVETYARPKKLRGGFGVGLGEFTFDGKCAQFRIRDKLGRVRNGAGLVFLLCNRIGRRNGENRIDQPLR